MVLDNYKSIVPYNYKYIVLFNYKLIVLYKCKYMVFCMQLNLCLSINYERFFLRA